MAGAKKVEDPPPAGAPLYMVSFGDMMTIILTFFILLCSYSKERHAGFVSDGVGSFRDTINAMGLPGLLNGDRYAVEIGARRVRYKPSKAVNSQLLEDANGSISDGNRDALRDVTKRALLEDGTSRIPIEIVFERGSSELTREHRAALDVVAGVLWGKNVVIRVEGWAFEENGPPRPVALARARAVAGYLVSEHEIDERRVVVVGYGSGGGGAENRGNRAIQDRLGRRIALIFLAPAE